MTDLTTQALQEILEVIKSTKGFAIEQAPLVAQEIVAWGQAKFYASAAISVAGVLLLVVAAGFAVRVYKDKNGEDYIPSAAFFGFTGLLMTLAGLCKSFDDLQAFIAPRLYILNEIAGMIRHG